MCGNLFFRHNFMCDERKIASYAGKFPTCCDYVISLTLVSAFTPSENILVPCHPKRDSFGQETWPLLFWKDLVFRLLLKNASLACFNSYLCPVTSVRHLLTYYAYPTYRRYSTSCILRPASHVNKYRSPVLVEVKLFSFFFKVCCF